MRLVFCTNNKHKLEEVSKIMGPTFSFATLEDIEYHKEIPEPYDSLELNSLSKARQVFDETALPCFAEDTGLFVESLDGRPGVYSARYAGEEASAEQNIQKLLSELSQETNRKAYFKTVITLISAEAIEQFSGQCDGYIAEMKSGNAGFGYDPVFIPLGYHHTFADIDAEEKNRISHRFKSFEAFKKYLHQLKTY